MSMRILLSAFACDPHFGSDEEVGWQWACQLAERGHDVTVLTRTSHRRAIESHIAETGKCRSVRFIYVDILGLHALLRRINRRNHIYYYFWQWAALARAREAHEEAPFDLVHHVTWVSFRQPSFMWALGIPFVFGPVAGGDEIPNGYASAFSMKQRWIERARHLLNLLVRFDPLMRLTYMRASRVYFTSEGHMRRVPKKVAERARIELAIGSDSALQEHAFFPEARCAGHRLVFVGRCIGLKGMDIGLRAFARALEREPRLTLTVIGDGADRARWQGLARELRIDSALTWLGWLSKDEVLAGYANYDLLFYPSLRDSGGFVVLEALQRGLPVVCFKLGGPGVVVDESCGEAVEAGPGIEASVGRFADAVLSVLERAHSTPDFSARCRARVSHFSWSALIDRIYSDAPTGGRA